jgi:hypothetical protein
MPASDPTLERTVVILCGPPGAGKSTLAHQSGFDVYDRGDLWAGHQQFTAAVGNLATQVDARAVVVIPGPSTAERLDACRLSGATHCYLVTAPPDELYKRLAARATRARATHLIGGWFDHHDTTDDVTAFPGWDHLGPPNVHALGQEATWCW